MGSVTRRRRAPALEALPVDLDPGGPQAAHRRQQLVAGLGASTRRRGRRVGTVTVAAVAVRMLPDQGAERAARPDLHADAPGFAQQLGQPFGEAHGPAHVAGPVGGIGQILGP